MDPKVALVQAQATSEGGGLRDEKWYLPLGPLSVATYLSQNGFTDVHVLDAEHDTIDRVLSWLAEQTPDIVGVNFNVFNTQLLDITVAAARELGALVVVGGQAATPIPYRLLSSNPNIDCVVVYDGERPMYEIVKRVAARNFDLRGIPNVICRDVSACEMRRYRFSRSSNALRNGSILSPDISSYPTIDRRLNGFDFTRYHQSWNRNDIDPLRVPTSIYTQKGCGKTCTFCARVDKQLRQRDVGRLYDEIHSLVQDGINYAYVVDDTFSADRHFLGALRNQFATRGELPIQFWAFADIRDLDDGTISLLKDIGVEKVLIGVESGSELLRKKNGKIFSNQMLFSRLSKLAKSNIKVEDSYVLGLAGESQETLYETFQLAKKVSDICMTEDTAFNIMTPLMGSPDWNRIMHVPELKKKYDHGYGHDVFEIREDYFRHFCNIEIEAFL